MATERELVALLYRADWTRLSLSGVVDGGDEEPGFPTLLVAPGRRYRLSAEDGRHVRGCDGERIWEWFPEPPPVAGARLAGGPEPPFPVLLEPSWLLSGYSLSLEEETTVCGRAGIRVAAVAVHRPNGRHLLGLITIAPLRWLPVVRYDRAGVVVDAELGILLRCEGQRGDDEPDVTSFQELTAGGDFDPERFTAPPGSVTGGGSGSSGWPFGEAGREAAKTVAGLAAGGLGAAIRYAPRKRQNPFAQATHEDDPEPVMPADDPAPAPAVDGGLAPVSDDVLHLLYRSGLGEPRFTATMHEWIDFAALLDAVPEAARKTGFGGVGLLVDALGDAARDAGAHHVWRVRMGGWDKYRIDLTYPAPRPDEDSRAWPGRYRTRPRTVACDGERRWVVYPGRVEAGPVRPPSDEIADLVDASWLLGCGLSGGAEVVAGGRPGYRVAVEGRRRAHSSLGGLMEFFFPAVAVVDAETGGLLRLTLYKGGKPVVRFELRDIAADESFDFGFTPPDGLPVAEEAVGDEPAAAPPNPVDYVAKAARDFFGRGGQR
jgi:hypothetical protein